MLDPIVPTRFALGLGASFVASTADWLPDHFVSTLKAAYAHKGFSFVHVLQRCPHFDPENFDNKSSAWFSFLTHENGIPADKRLADKTGVVTHDSADHEEAFRIANSPRTHFGLFYRNPERPCYDEMIRRRIAGAKPMSRAGILDSYKI
jgi:2-oxoglutarate ferredoxin oxidoreductase subunit beta